MAENNPSISNLRNLLDYDARSFTCVEIQLKKSLIEWINKTNSRKLNAVLQRYLFFVEEHIRIIEFFLEEEQIYSEYITNQVMKAFTDQAEVKLSYCSNPEIADASLLACVQGINHFKISMYGTAAAYAVALKMERPAAIFHEAEVNEKQIDDRLSQLAEHEINVYA